jgi:hypothetical protein
MFFLSIVWPCIKSDGKAVFGFEISFRFLFFAGVFMYSFVATAILEAVTVV